MIVVIVKEGESSSIYTIIDFNTSYYSFWYTYQQTGSYNIIVKIKELSSSTEIQYNSKAKIV
jgi:hypothetical protein